MSGAQTPPVTVITVPPPATTTTTSATTTTTAGATRPTVATTLSSTDVSTGVTGAAPAEGLVILVFMAIGATLALVAIAASAVRQRRAKRAEPPVVLPSGASLADKVREVAARAATEDPVEVTMDDVSMADLYPWLESPADLTLVVDLRTAEALQEVGVTSLAQLASIDDETLRSMNAAGVELDARTLQEAARDILGRKADGEVG